MNSEPLAALEQPHVEPMKLIAFDSHAKTTVNSNAFLFWAVHRFYVKHLVFDHATPKNEALHTSSPNFAQLAVGCVTQLSRYDETLNRLESDHSGGMATLKVICGVIST